MASEEEPGGEMSQERIDAALTDASGETGAEDAESKPEPAGDGAAPEPESADGDALLSQADLDAAVGGGGGDPPVADQTEQSQDDRVDSAGNPLDDVAAAMASAIEDERPSTDSSAIGSDPKPAGLPDFGSGLPASETTKQIDLLEDVELNVKIELGRTEMLVEDVLQLDEGSVVELDKLAGDPVDVFVNERLVARGEVLVLNDNFCVRINEIMSQKGEAIRS